MEEMKTSISSAQAYNRSNLLGQDGGMEPEGLDNSGSNMRGSTSLLKKSNDVGLNQVQICNSLNNTESVKSAMMTAVNSVRAAACEGECRYVASENTKKMTMEIQIREEDIACKEKLEQILRKWQELMSCKAPQELAHQISEQCKADKMIHEQQLGWLWHPPPKDIFLSFGYFISVEEKGQEEHAPIRFESCQVSCESSNDMQLTRSDEQIKTDESTRSVFERSSPKDLARYQAKAGKLPSIVEMEKTWRSYSELIAPKVLHVWAAFAAALVSYNQLLKNRAKLMHEVYLISQERKVLQGAVEYCMSSKAGVQRVVKSRDIGSGRALKY